MDVASRHMRVGWWGLAVFVTLGAVLEAFHAYKSPFYLDASSETRRLLFRLAHAHGALIALINIVFALTVKQKPEASSRVASAALLASLVLLPGGFFAGGIVIHGGDPGLPAALIPVGALALLLAVVIVA